MSEQIVSKLFAELGFKVDDKNLLKFKLKLVATSTALIKFTNDVIKSVVSLDNFNKRTGINENFVQDWVRMGEIANVSENEILSALEHISQAKQDILRGDGNIQPWALLGVDPTKNPEEVFQNIIKNISQVQDAATRSKLLSDVGLSEQLQNLINVDTKGSYGASLNFGLTKEDRNVILELNKQINIFKQNLSILKDKLVVILSPVRIFFEVCNKLSFIFLELVNRTVGLDKVITILKIAGIALIAAWKPILLLFTGIALIIEDLYVYFKGGDSLIGSFIDKIKKLWKEGDYLKSILLALGPVLVGAFAIAPLLTPVLSIFKAMSFGVAGITKSIVGLTSSFAPLLVAIGSFAAGWKLGEQAVKWLDKFFDFSGNEEFKKSSEEYNQSLSLGQARKELQDKGVLRAGERISQDKLLELAKQNNIQITNNMNITGNNAEQIANTIINKEKQQLDNTTIQMI